MLNKINNAPIKVHLFFIRKYMSVLIKTSIKNIYE